MGFPINKLCLCCAKQNLTSWCCDCRNYGFSGRLLLLLLLDNERSLMIVLTYKREWTMKIIWLAVFSGVSWREIEVFKLSCFWFVIDNIDVFSDSLNLVVCNNWFAIGCLISLWFLQPGPCDFPHQCLIKRNKKTSTFYLYLAFTPCEYVHENNFGMTSSYMSSEAVLLLLIQILTCKSLKAYSKGAIFLVWIFKLTFH